MRFLIAIVSLVCCTSLYAQNTKEKVLDSAVNLYNAHQYQEAYNLFQETFQMKDKGRIDADNYFYAAATAAQCKQYDTAFKWLYDYADNTTFPQTVYTKLLVDFESLYPDKRWNKFVDYLQNKEDSLSRSKHYNLALKKELDQMWYDDQFLRYRIDVYEKKYGDTSKMMDEFWNKMRYTDSTNLVKLKTIFENHGWVSKKEVGNSSTVQWIIIQHSDTATINKYLPLLKKEADSGEVSKSSLALTIDRANINNGKKQIYGSQVMSANTSLHRPAYIQPLEDPDNVDNRRKEMGLGPITDYAKSFGIIWNLEEYKKMLPTYEKWQWGNKESK